MSLAAYRFKGTALALLIASLFFLPMIYFLVLDPFKAIVQKVNVHYFYASTTGKIIFKDTYNEIKIIPGSSEESTPKVQQCNVLYSYDVNGKKYQNSRIGLSDDFITSRLPRGSSTRIRNLSKIFHREGECPEFNLLGKVGDPITIYYDKANPQKSVLFENFPYAAMVPQMYISLVPIILYFALVRGILRLSSVLRTPGK
ncbi:DUF3592 domain-containing protein [Deinococcus navajonensis]|uniref:DUF3592 domain-containing protein n=1 Tax=Deinococcus navajonensis TaxID=309884 RepID=A0ABV8XJM5_9DEIO